MANPTSAFGWQMPTSTDLVTDLPADFETFGQAVDTSLADLKGGTTGQVLSKNSNTDMDFVWAAPTSGDIEGVTAGTGISGGGTSGTVTITNSMATAITTNGDLIYGTGSGTFTRRGIGSTGQILTVSGGVPTWATPTGGGMAFTELSATGASGSTVTISGLSGYNTLIIYLEGISSDTANSNMFLRINADTGGNYSSRGLLFINNTALMYSDGSSGATQVDLGKNQNTADTMSGFARIDGANSTGVKVGQSITGADGSSSRSKFYGFRYTGGSVVSSISIVNSGGNFDAGTIRVLGSLI